MGSSPYTRHHGIKCKSNPDRVSTPKVEKKINGPHKILVCIHCGKSGGEGSMKRWHFDNCKFKIEHLQD